MQLLAFKIIGIIPFMCVNSIIVVNLLARPHLHTVFNIGHILHGLFGLAATPSFLVSSFYISTVYISFYSKNIS